jgi:hypothetical protein
MKLLFTLWNKGFIVIFLLAMLQLISCQCNRQKTQEKILEETIENSTGQKTDAEIDGDKVTIEGENYKAELDAKGGKWASEIPECVPEFNYGKISHSSFSEAEGTKTWAYIIKDAPLEVLGKYEALLKKNGFQTMKMSMGKGGSVTGEKDSIIVSLITGEEMTHVSVQVRHGQQ